MTVFQKMIQLMKDLELVDVLLTGVGIIPEQDRKALNEMGVGKLFPPGTPTKEIADYISNWTARNRNL